MKRTLFDFKKNDNLNFVALKRNPGKAVVLWWLRLGQHLINFLTSEPKPRIWLVRRNGCEVWYAQDPRTGKIDTRYSEDEIRIWLEERYYHK